MLRKIEVRERQTPAISVAYLVDHQEEGSRYGRGYISGQPRPSRPGTPSLSHWGEGRRVSKDSTRDKDGRYQQPGHFVFFSSAI
jgi:hypothetical protein